MTAKLITKNYESSSDSSYLCSCKYKCTHNARRGFFFEDLILVSYRLERLIVNPSLEVGYFIIERWKMQDLKESC